MPGIHEAKAAFSSRDCLQLIGSFVKLIYLNDTLDTVPVISYFVCKIYIYTRYIRLICMYIQKYTCVYIYIHTYFIDLYVHLSCTNLPFCEGAMHSDPRVKRQMQVSNKNKHKLRVDFQVGISKYNFIT